MTRIELRVEIDDQFFSARTLAGALMQLFSVCKWPSKNIVHDCRNAAERFFAPCQWLPARFRKLSALLK